MNDRDQKRCRKMILQYKWARWLGGRAWHTQQDKEVWEHVKARLRNTLFEVMQKDLGGYVKRCLGEWKKQETPKEILYLSWQSFLFGLAKYRNFERPLTFHFYSYTRYFLLDHYGRKNQVFLSLDDLKDILSVNPTEDNSLFIRLMTVQHFKELLAPRYHFVFDDAFESLHGAKQHQVTRWTKESGLQQIAYKHLRNVFKTTIRYLIG